MSGGVETVTVHKKLKLDKRAGRDSPQIGIFTGGYTPDKTIGAVLQMEGRSGRNEDDVKAVTGQEIKRPRRWHKIFERMGILYPGEGATRLARLSALAKAVYGQPTVDRPHLTMIEVRPDWTDGTQLLGHYDPIGAKYVRAPFLDAMLTAAEEAVPVFVCLDEMNLARVEYYLADCLSAMESGNEIILDTRGDATIANSVKWSPNLFLFGTVNIDESTLRISDKVLDRAQVIDTSDVDLTSSLEKWLSEASALDAGERIRTKEILEGTWKTLRVVDAHFGFRTARAVIRFVNEAKASSDGALTVDSAIDAQLCQKVLTKMRGEGEHWSEPLRRLEEIFQKLGLQSRSATVLGRMRRDLERFGSFQFWN